MSADVLDGPALPDSLRLERVGEVAVLRIARPHKRNALDDPTVLGIGAFFEQLPPWVRVVVLDAEGPHFCAGLDLSELRERDALEGLEHSRMWHRVFDLVEKGSVPVVSVLRGAVIGGGLELAAATHVRVAEPSAFFALPEGQRGLFVGGGGSVRIPRLIGVARMTDMMLTGRVLSAQEGYAAGLTQYLVEDGAGLETALGLARRMAGNAPHHELRCAAGAPTDRRVLARGRPALRVVRRLDEWEQPRGPAPARAVPGRRGTEGGAVSDTPELVRNPAADSPATTRIGRFAAAASQLTGTDLHDYQRLWRWSVDDLEGFWSLVWDHHGVTSTTARGPVFDEATGPSMPGARWFPGARVSYARHLLEDADPGRVHDDEVAVLAYSQTRSETSLTFAELRVEVARVRAGLLDLGVRPGDRVAAYLPNLPETLVAFLATASLGAVWCACAPEFGARSVVDRFAQVEPTVLLAVTGYRYGDKPVDRRDELERVRAGLPSVSTVVHVPYGEWDELPPGAVPWAGVGTPGAAPEYADVPFDHPLCVLFSSGTTGRPKAIVHGHGGILLEHLKNHALSWDLGPGDRMLWFTTTAWMMWNALVSCLLVRAGVVLVDGNPLPPSPTCSGGWPSRRAPPSSGSARASSWPPSGLAPHPARSSTCRRCARSAPPAARSRQRATGGWPSSSPACFSTSAAGAPTCAAASSRAHPRSRSGPGRSRGRVSACTPRRSTTRGSRWWASSASRDHRPHAVDAGRLLGRHRRQPVPVRLLRPVPGYLAAR